MKIDWKRKLSSRKFWAAATGWLTSLLAAFNVPQSNIDQTILIACGVGSLIAYMFAEGIADCKNNNKD